MRPAVLLALLVASGPAAADPPADPYEAYVRTAAEFRPVRQDAAATRKGFPAWTVMPWPHQWAIGYTEAAGDWCRATGYTGAVLDRADTAAAGRPRGKLDWVERAGLRFYVDHAAGKGLLHLYDGGQEKPHLAALHGAGVRPVPLTAATRDKLRATLRASIAAVKDSPNRAAYALDDEPSWGHFVHPTMWQVTDDPAAYPAWLRAVYGPAAPTRDRWVTYEDIRPKLADWRVRDFDASPLLDQWTFNDSVWANLVGGLVEYANALDPATPCGLVGAQAPSPFGGYDYAKLMRKVQFIEAYNLGSARHLVRSFNPANAVPAVTTVFHQSAADDIWQAWANAAHGGRGHIGWVENWFDGATPKPWHAEVGPTYRELGDKIGPLVAGHQWRHDGVAVYYSHASVQLGWVLDAAAHGKTWTNRNNDHRLAGSAHVRRAWETMLTDAGVQFRYVNYADVIRAGVPAEFKVLVLPACLCLSDAEARRIEAFCRRGGTVVADYLPGVWDQHGKGRPAGGALDGLFGVAHPTDLSARGVFAGTRWVEVDQDAHYDWKTYADFLADPTLPTGPGGFRVVARGLPVGTVTRAGAGRAVLMNLSPQMYNAYRAAGPGPAAARDVFLAHVTAAGVTPRVRVTAAGDAALGHEVTYWHTPGPPGTPGRTVAFVVQNPDVGGGDQGGGNAVGLRTAAVPVTLRFARTVTGVRDERAGKNLGDGREFTLVWKQNEAAVVSFDEP